MLDSIALLPLLAPRCWHRHYGKVALAWELPFLLPYALYSGVHNAAEHVVHTALLQYIPFVVILFALFTVAGGDAVRLMGRSRETLMAISCGAVYMGALTYIGNAPNFMVKAIAEDQGVAMPSFLGYLLYSVLILVPAFVALTLLFF